MSESGFQVHLLRFRAEVTAPLELPAATGAALRGALFGALRAQFCLAAGGPGCGQTPLAEACPVCFLLAPIEAGNQRGRDVPRPYVLRVEPGAGRVYRPGERFEFGLATFGRALSHFPYALLGVQEMGRLGLGARRAGGFQLSEVWAENPLTGRQERLHRVGEAAVRAPSLPIDQRQVLAEAEALAASGGARRLRLRLLSPTRLVQENRLVKAESFSPDPFVARLLERLTAIFGRYGGQEPTFDAPRLREQARLARLAERQLVWRELFRASGRHRRPLPMSGLVGEVVLEGELGSLLPWLVWGSLTHVGKDAAMGNGWYALEAVG